MSRRRKVMKVKTREGTERNSCSSIAANKDTARLTEEEEQTAQIIQGFGRMFVMLKDFITQDGRNNGYELLMICTLDREGT